MTTRADSASGEPCAPGRILRLTQPLVRFLHVESASGSVLAVCTIVALAEANSPWADSCARLWDRNIRVGAGALELFYPLWYWINDAFMVLFLLVIGLEIKRELVSGELRDARRIVLPVAAALGGVAAPIAIFLAISPEGPGRAGWAVPMATDIAFVIMPLFALANAGVPISSSTLDEPIAMAAGVGLLVGKPIGILLASWLAIRLGLAKLPTGVGWHALAGAASLCGVGFTMAIFIASLSVEGPLLVAAKSGVLIGSGLSIGAGMFLLDRALRRQSSGPRREVPA